MRAQTIAATAVAMAVVLGASPSWARLWKPTPQQLAADYLTLIHNKGSEGRVTVSWVAASAAIGVVFQQLMEKYVVISIVHARTEPDGTTSWDDVQGVQVTDGNGQALKEVPFDEAAPAIAGLTASASAMKTPVCARTLPCTKTSRSNSTCRSLTCSIGRSGATLI